LGGCIANVGLASVRVGACCGPTDSAKCVNEGVRTGVVGACNTAFILSAWVAVIACNGGVNTACGTVAGSCLARGSWGTDSGGVYALSSTARVNSASIAIITVHGGVGAPFVNKVTHGGIASVRRRASNRVASAVGTASAPWNGGVLALLALRGTGVTRVSGAHVAIVTDLPDVLAARLGVAGVNGAHVSIIACNISVFNPCYRIASIGCA